jgi:hypothetical protein
MKRTNVAVKVLVYKRYLIVPRARKFFIYGPTNRPLLVLATMADAKQWVDNQTQYDLMAKGA